MSRSPNQTRPEVGTVSPEMSRKNVVLPEPLGPMIERSSQRLTVPRAYGGVGADPIAYVHALREMAHGCSATALTFNMHSTITSFIDALGTEAQKRRWFAEVVEHGRLIASITSEPEQSFRDKFVLNTVFRPADGGWRVAGVKQFCSIGDAADY